MMIGLHRQSATDEELADVVKKNKVKFPITTGGSIPSKGSGIPHTLLFDADGKCVFEGHPSDREFEKALRKALGAVKAAAKAAPATGAKPGAAAEAKPLIAMREWKSADGRSMKAELVSVKDGTATFKLATGKSIPLKLDKLSAEDQKLITETAGSEEKSKPPTML
jgi:hypothetical protein